jgi:hypothetical protein
MGITQLDPTIPIDTPKGSAHAWFLIDYSTENDLFWVCAIDATGEIWILPNADIRAQKNITMGRYLSNHISRCI